MDYFKELNAFRNWLLLNELTTSGIALWHTLMSVNNMTGWKHWFNVPNSTLQQLTNLSKQGLVDARLLLINKGLIEYKKGKQREAGKYKMISLVNSLDQTLDQELDQSLDPPLDQELDQTPDQNLTIPRQRQEGDKKEKQEKEIPFSEIVEYLNFKTGKQFKSSSKKTREHISARWNEGHRLIDFKKVIDVKAEQWLGDSKMESYLRPSTLFRPGNFENYLNEKSNVVPIRDEYKSDSVDSADMFDMGVDEYDWGHKLS